MAGKSYIKSGSSWKKIKRMYIKTGPAWSSIKKAYVKTGSVWKKIFDTTSNAPYSTEVPTIRLDSYTGTIISAATIDQYWDPTGESRVGIKLYGRENPSSWRNGPFTKQEYQWWVSEYANGQDGWMIKETTDTYYSISSELNDDYDGLYLFFRAVYTNTYNKVGTANSLPVFLHKNAPSKYTSSGGWSTNGITSSLTQTGTPIKVNYSFKNEYYRSINSSDSVIEWYRGAPLSDKSNLVQSTDIFYSTIEIDDGQELSGYDEYIPDVNDVGQYIYVKITASNSYTKSPMWGTPIVDQYSTSSAVAARPTIVTMPSITKVDGYQTIGYTLRGNTGTYNITPTRVYWGFQYASSATTPDSQWRTFQTRSINPISYTYSYTNYYGNETSQNQNHDFLLPARIWDAGLDLEVPLAGKYLRFYSIADGAGTQSDTYNSEVVGPIYSRVTKPGNPVVSYTSAHSTGYSNIAVYWTDATVFKTYKLQYSSDAGTTWSDLTTTTSSTNPNGAYFDPVAAVVPTGELKYRVRNINEEGQYVDSDEIFFTTNADYTFSLGKTLYVGTNGYIGVDEGYSYGSLPATGRYLSFFTRDLEQASLRYWSDSTNFTVLWDGYVYQKFGQSAYRITYEAHFYSTYVDFKFINFGSSVGVPDYSIGMYQGENALNGVMGPYGYFAGASYRVYYGPTTGSTSPGGFTNVVSANMIQDTTNNAVDDGYTTIVTAQNMYEIPTWTKGTETITGTQNTVSFSTNSSYSKYKYIVRYNNSSGNLVYESSSYEATSPMVISNLASGTDYWVSVTPYNSYNQAGTAVEFTFSTLSAPGAFNIVSAEKEMKDPYNLQRQVYVSWDRSSNANRYEVQVQGSSNGTTWSDVTTFDQSPYSYDQNFFGSYVDNSRATYNTFRFKTMELFPGTQATLRSFVKNYYSFGADAVPTVYTGNLGSVITNSSNSYIQNVSSRTFNLGLYATNSNYTIYNNGTFLILSPRLQGDYKYYRVSVRSSNSSNPGVYTYSGGGTLASPNYFNASGYAPISVPGITATPTSDGASVSFLLPESYNSELNGSSNIVGVQISSDNFNWGTAQSSPITITGLTAGSSYTYYARFINGDDLTSSSQSFTFIPAGDPKNTALPTITTNNSTNTVFASGNTITINAGTWENTASYKYELFYGSSTPVAVTSTAAKTLVNTNQYVITNADATNTSYYFRAKVTGYKGASQTGTSVVAWSETSARSIIVPSTTLTVDTPTASGFKISGTSPNYSSNIAYASITAIKIYDSNQTLSTTITTGLPAISGTDGTWSYTWAGGTKSTDYYVKVDMKSTDTSETTSTTAFSSKITTSSGPVNTAVPTITTNNATNTVFQAGNTITVNAGTWTGASSYKYELFYGSDTNIDATYSSKTLSTNTYTITNTDAYGEGTATSYYFRGRVTAYSGASQTGVASDPVWTTVSAQSILNPSSTISLATATTSGFTVSGTATPFVNPTAYTKVTKIEIFDSSDNSVSAITTGMPTVGGSNGNWSYVWTGGAASTTYKAKVTITALDDAGTTFTSGFSSTITTSSSTPVYSPVVWGAMSAPAFNRLNTSSRLRWGWNNQLPTSGDYTASNITWEWQYSTSNATTSQSASPTGLISSGTRPNRSSGGLTVGTSTYNNRVSSISGDYGTGNAAGANEPVIFNTNNRYLRYRAVVVGSNGTTYRSNYSAWV